MTPGGAVDRHLFELLEGIGSGYYYEIAPAGTQGVYVVSSELGPQGVTNESDEAENFEYLRRVYAVSHLASMPEAEADAIRAALSKATTVQGDFEVYSKLRDPYEFAGLDGGRHYRQEGGDFWILVRPAP